MTLIRMLFGIVAGIVYIWTLDIYVLRQIGQIKSQIGQKNLNINHICTYNMILDGYSKVKISFFKRNIYRFVK